MTAMQQEDDHGRALFPLQETKQKFLVHLSQ